MLFIFETEVACPPADVFAKMADVRNEMSWNSAVSSAELVSDEPIREGSVFTTVNRGKEYEATLTTFESPTRLAFEVTGRQMDITALFAFTARGEGTSLRGEFDLRPKGFFKVMFPLVKPMVRRGQEKESQNFKAFCEAG